MLELCKKSQEEIDGDRHRRERLAEMDKQIAEQETQIAALQDCNSKYRELLIANGIEVPE